MWMEDKRAKGYNPKHITFNMEGLNGIERGLKTLTNIVKKTYGPRGSNVVLIRAFDSPIIINEARTICKDFSLDDHFENMGVQLLQEALLKVKKTVGDGSTTTAILLEAMIANGIKYIAYGHNPMQIKKGMENCTKAVLKCLHSYAKQLHIDTDLKHLVRMSSSNEEIASLIEEAVKMVGKDGIILVAESKRMNSELVVQEGIFLERGFVSNVMAKDTQKIETHMEEPYIFITDKKLTSHLDVLPLLEQISQLNGSLFIIADSIEGSALSTLLVNQIKGTLNVVAIQAPDYGDQRAAILEDLSLLTGGIVYNQELDSAHIPLDYFGRAKKIIVSKKSTLILGGERKEDQIKLRIKQVNEEMEAHITQYDRERFEKRLGNLIGKTAFINIGAVNDIEIGDLLQKVENAVYTVKSALKYGILPGGGSAYIKALSEVSVEMPDDGDQRCGFSIILNALLQPTLQLLENADVNKSLNHEIIECYKKKDNVMGYDIEASQWVNMYEYGLIDSYQMVKTSLEVASSLAASLLTSTAAITDFYPD
jgi:chaperonin GroEL